MTTPTRMPLLERSLCRSMPAQRPTTMLTRFTQLLHPVRWGRYPASELSNALRCARTALIAAIRRGLNLRRSPAGGGASGSRHCRCLVAVGRLPPPSQSRYSVPTGGPRQTCRQGAYPPILPSPTSRCQASIGVRPLTDDRVRRNRSKRVQSASGGRCRWEIPTGEPGSLAPVPGERLLDRAGPATVGTCGPCASSSRFSPPEWALVRRSPRSARTGHRTRVSPAPAPGWAPRSRARSCRLLRPRQEAPVVRRHRRPSGPIRTCGRRLAARAPRSLSGSPSAKPPGAQACWPPATGSKCPRPRTPGRRAGRRSLDPCRLAGKARRSGCGCRRRQPAGASPATRLPYTCSAAPTARRRLPASRRLHVPSSPP